MRSTRLISCPNRMTSGPNVTRQYRPSGHRPTGPGYEPPARQSRQYLPVPGDTGLEARQDRRARAFHRPRVSLRASGARLPHPCTPSRPQQPPEARAAAQAGRWGASLALLGLPRTARSARVRGAASAPTLEATARAGPCERRAACARRWLGATPAEATTTRNSGRERPHARVRVCGASTRSSGLPADCTGGGGDSGVSSRLRDVGHRTEPALRCRGDLGGACECGKGRQRGEGAQQLRHGSSRG